MSLSRYSASHRLTFLQRLIAVPRSDLPPTRSRSRPPLEQSWRFGEVRRGRGRSFQVLQRLQARKRSVLADWPPLEVRRASRTTPELIAVRSETRPKDTSDYAEDPILSGQDWAKGEGKRESRIKAEKRNEMVAVRTKRAARSAAGCWGRHWKAVLVGITAFVVA